MLEALGASFLLVLVCLAFVGIIYGVIYLILRRIKNTYIQNACLAVFMFFAFVGNSVCRNIITRSLKYVH